MTANAIKIVLHHFRSCPSYNSNKLAIGLSDITSALQIETNMTNPNTYVVMGSSNHLKAKKMRGIKCKFKQSSKCGVHK